MIRYLSPRFKPYFVENGLMDMEEIVNWYKPIQNSMVDLGLVNEFSVYENLLDFLTNNVRFDVRPLAELFAPLHKNRIRICLRHDIDSLLPPALLAANALSSRGLVGSFYFLHTATYYGVFAKNTFCRNVGIDQFLTEFIKHNQEIGLHIDPLHVYYAFGFDGAQSVVTELSWLRSHGIDVKGVLAHNSAPVYGAENFEIFSGLALDNRSHVTHKGIKVPLQTIKMDDIGLMYEGNYPSSPHSEDKHLLDSYLAYVPNDALRRSDWLSVYLQHNPVFSRKNDVDIWLIGKDSWAISQIRPTKKFLFNISSTAMLNFLETYNHSGSVIITIHPEYVSA